MNKPQYGDPVLQWRHARLLELIDQFEGKLSRLVDAADLDYSTLNQIKNEHRGMGPEIARKLEERLGLPPGYMSTAPESGTAEPAAEYNTEMPHDEVFKRMARAWSGLTKSQQVETMRGVEETEQANRALIEELSGKRSNG